MRGLFVTATGTGVGKTIVSAALLAAMRAAGARVCAHKPVLTGLEQPRGRLPPDDELLALAAGMRPRDVAPMRFGPAVSPHLAGALAGRQLDRDELLRNAWAATRHGDVLIVEGVGGLLVPLVDAFTIRDLAVELELPLLIAARPGLGTINHTLLTLESARHVGLDVRAIVLTPWPKRASALQRSNRETIARLGRVEVCVLPRLAQIDLGALAGAGATLPFARWL